MNTRTDLSSTVIFKNQKLGSTLFIAIQVFFFFQYVYLPIYITLSPMQQILWYFFSLLPAHIYMCSLP